MFITQDQTGTQVRVEDFPPKRIISLVPSQTELLHDLGLEYEVVGITKFCVHPRSWFTSKKRVGGTKTVDIDTVRELNPDLIIANKEENVQSQVDALRAIAPVWVSDISNLPDALDMIKQVGLLINREQQAKILVWQIETNFSKLAEPPTSQLLNPSTDQPPNRPTVAYLIWREPYMTVGGDTFISDMLRRCGFANAFEYEKRYPQITLEKLSSINCNYIFLSSEPYPFKQKHAEEIRKQLPGKKVVFVNGELFSWYGSRLLQATQYFKELKNSLDGDSEPRFLTTILT